MAARTALVAGCLLASLAGSSAQGLWGPNGSSTGSPQPYTGSQASPAYTGPPGPSNYSPAQGSPASVPSPPSGAAPAVAALAKPGIGSGAWFGVSKDFTSEPLSVYLPRAGVEPVAYNVYIDLPLDANSTALLQLALPQIAEQNAVVLLTVEPIQGLANVTDAAIGTLAYYIKQFQLGGGKVMVSFGQEMNGDWYIWGQQPMEYVAAYQRVYNVLQASTCGVDMVWAPNAAVGYPWRGGTTSIFGAQAGSQDFVLMDTNGDGELDINDDPYTPFYPGDEYVAWVGMSAYSWGGSGSAPYTNNILSGPQQFDLAVTGDGTTINDLYDRFSGDGYHNKPMVLTETSAMYLPSVTVGVSNLQVKSTWWTQVFNTQGDNSQALDVSIHYPNIKMIMWFDIEKPEASANGLNVDWRFSGDPAIAGAFVDYLNMPKAGWNGSYWGTLPAFSAAGLGHSCPTNNTPGTTPTSIGGRRLLA